ncbi:hypothetical protein DL95DRAFT_492159 [Leptodontidium sp. 2 PMI_412]|nr:hypothetical protein DL95DRAFT_492159 [Leptodontidium sp. 2 PMI_412]
MMGPSQTANVVLFDLDNTLFVHYHSQRSGISAVQENNVYLAEEKRNHLIDTCNSALQDSYGKYLAKKITYEETDATKVRLFFARLGLPEPSLKEVGDSREIYKEAFRVNRRATPGAVETLVRLHENGYCLGIVTNGKMEDQADRNSSSHRPHFHLRRIWIL